MTLKRGFIICLLPVVQFCIAAAGYAQDATPLPLLHPLFTDNAVLQRDMPCPIWGWTTPGATVTVSILGKSATAVADKSGKWMVRVGPFPAGGPHRLTVSGPQKLAARNILFGDVFICSGQSNMQMAVASSNNAQQEIAAANYPQIRLFTVPDVTAYEPQQTVNAKWVECSPETIPWFSAAGYFFGRELNQRLKIPIGLINSSWGGTIAEAWVSGPALKTMPDFADAVKKIEQAMADQKQHATDFAKAMDDWYAKNDPGSAQGLGWADPGFDASSWKTMQLPTAWESAGLPDFDGIVWFRKEIDVAADQAGKEAVLHLGPIDDRDTTWVNGVKVGAMDQYDKPRDYKLAANVLKAGRNVVAVRVLDTGGAGGLNGKPEQMSLEIGGQSQTLAGPWLYQDSTPLAKTSPQPMKMDNNPNVVTVLYNAMIAPLTPMALKGAIWYQGESNNGRGLQYQTLLPTLIKDWRARFSGGDFFFGVVQLANFMAQENQPSDAGWPRIQEAQWLTTKRVPNTALACIVDIGDAKDIHPKDKQDVGLRLALGALGTTYGQKIEFSGPQFKAMKIEGGKVRISYSHIGGGLVVKGDKLTGFAVAGKDKNFVWADATVDGDTVVLSAAAVAEPVAVRYAWANNPVCNLYNKAELPAVPFRTDDW